MRHNMRNILFVSMLMLGLCISTLAIVAVSQPTIISITHSPDKPAPKSTITFNARLSGDNISEVYITVKECEGDFCYAKRHNVSMQEVADGEYQADVTLIQGKADNIGYWLIIKSDGAWYDFKDDFEELDLKTGSNGQNNNGNSNNSPGFELILVLISIAIIVFIFNRKREK